MTGERTTRFAADPGAQSASARLDLAPPLPANLVRSRPSAGVCLDVAAYMGNDTDQSTLMPRYIDRGDLFLVAALLIRGRSAQEEVR